MAVLKAHPSVEKTAVEKDHSKVDTLVNRTVERVVERKAVQKAVVMAC